MATTTPSAALVPVAPVFTNTERRGKTWAFEQAMGAVWFYAESNPAMGQMGRRTLERIQEDPSPI